MPRPRFEKLPPEKRETILETAAKEFAEFGYEGASLNQILAKSGISKGAAYYYFDNKEDFAIVFDSEGSAGVTYNFFVQGLDSKLSLNTFLTDTLRVFPVQFYPKTKRLKSEARSGTCWHFETIYQLKNTSDWRVVSSTRFDDCKGAKSTK